MLKRVKAFTIIELVVALVISSVVITILYYAYFLISKQFRAYRDKATATSEFFLLETALQHDIDRSDVIRDSAGVLLLETSGRGVTEYRAGTSGITRFTGGSVDSFAVMNEGWTVQPYNDAMPLITGIRIKISIGGERIETVLHKSYSAAQLLLADNSQDE